MEKFLGGLPYNPENAKILKELIDLTLEKNNIVTFEKLPNNKYIAKIKKESKSIVKAFTDYTKFRGKVLYYTLEQDANKKMFLRESLVGSIEYKMYLELDCYITYLEVKEKYQNLGIGSKLLADAEKIANSKNLDLMKLHSKVRMERSKQGKETIDANLEFYKKNGFTPINHCHSDAVVLMKKRTLKYNLTLKENVK